MQGPTTSRQSPGSPWSADFRPYQHGEVSCTPAGYPVQPSVGSGSMPSPFLFSGHPSDSSTASPNYFGIVVDNTSNPPGSTPGPYVKRHWDSIAQASSSLSSPAPHPVAPNQAHQNLLRLTGSVNAGPESTQLFSPPQPTPYMDTSASPAMRKDEGFFSLAHKDSPQETTTQPKNQTTAGDAGDSYFFSLKLDLKRQSSAPFARPARTDSSDPGSTGSDSNGPAANTLRGPFDSPLSGRSPPVSSAEDSRQADSLPATLGQDAVSFISAELCAELIKTASDKLLLLDVRPFPQFSRSSIMESLNLCIPTTLLKRPSFNTDKLKDTFVSDSEKRKFSTWKTSTYIIVYDSNTDHPRDTMPLINVFKKFRSEGWQADARILRGGFANFANQFPDLVRDQHQNKEAAAPIKQPRSMSLSLPSVAPVAGGCSLPNVSAANPFFSNIRQNMDLVGGVGQVPVKLPEGLTSNGAEKLPLWLRKASASEDKGYEVSQKFLKIEERELHRMREALASSADYEGHSPTKFRVAGIEKGSKNRYNDIYPFEHSRVRLQDVAPGDCDYINASHVKAELSNKHYIATQAPVPATFEDFWRTVWEQNVRVLVALTAEVERGQIKCHPYWKPGDYGPFKVKVLAEKRVFMDSKHNGSPARSRESSLEPSPPPGSRATTEEPHSADEEDPFITVRHFTILHSSYPFQPIREVTQLQYPHWPDFGTTSQPAHLLKLVEQCNKITRKNSGLSLSMDDAEPPGQRPVLVHCSAGCGRTGTFCTVDSVLDTLKRQRQQQVQQDDSVDLIAKTVEDFRKQRPSMIQNLGQFVLCYESVLEWVVTRN